MFWMRICNSPWNDTSISSLLPMQRIVRGVYIQDHLLKQGAPDALNPQTRSEQQARPSRPDGRLTDLLVRYAQSGPSNGVRSRFFVSGCNLAYSAVCLDPTPRRFWNSPVRSSRSHSSARNCRSRAT